MRASDVFRMRRLSPRAMRATSPRIRLRPKKRGDKPEWQHNQDYWAKKDEFPAIDLRDKAFVYE